MKKLVIALIIIFIFQCTEKQILESKEFNPNLNSKKGTLLIHLISEDGFSYPKIEFHFSKKYNQYFADSVLKGIPPFPEKKEPFPILTKDLEYSLIDTLKSNNKSILLSEGIYYATFTNYRDGITPTIKNYFRSVYVETAILFGYDLDDEEYETTEFNDNKCKLRKFDRNFLLKLYKPSENSRFMCPKIIIKENEITILNIKVLPENFKLGSTVIKWVLPPPLALLGLGFKTYTRDVEVELVNPK